jgi:hypothetical protein
MADMAKKTTLTSIEGGLTDSDQLAVYSQAVARTMRLAKKDDTKAWELSLRAMMLAARTLRISNQAKVHPEKAGRASKRSPSYYDTMPDGDDG